MTILTNQQKTTIASLAAKKENYNVQVVALKMEYDRLKGQLQVELAKAVLEALAQGVPQTKIGMEALGYGQANGIRSFFGLPMRGHISDHLKALIAGHSNEGLGKALAEVTLAQGSDEILFYDSNTPFQGQPVYIMELPTGEKYKFCDNHEFGTLYWQSRPKGADLTDEQVALLNEHLPEIDGKRSWQFDPKKNTKHNQPRNIND